MGQNIKHGGLWSDEEKTVAYKKKNLLHDGLWSDEEKTVAYEKQNIKHDGLWSEDEVTNMAALEPQGIELVEMESMVYIEEEEKENNNFWYFVGGAAVGTLAMWMFGGKTTTEKVIYLPRVEYVTKNHTKNHQQ